jgi:hypothetical protein
MRRLIGLRHVSRATTAKAMAAHPETYWDPRDV